MHPSWQAYFTSEMSATTSPHRIVADILDIRDTAETAKLIRDHLKVALLVRAHQVRGHLKARIDPLGIMQPDRDWCPAPELEYTYYGFTEADLSRQFMLGMGMLPEFSSKKPQMTLQEIIDQLRATYCGTIGYEYTHIPDRAQCDWIRSRVEVPEPYRFTLAERRVMLDRLMWAELFEKFVASKYPSEKRFGLEGGESLVPGMKALIDASVEHGVEAIVMGMSHRGRLNVLSNVIRKPNESIFSEFSGIVDLSTESSGDVKYHLGMNYDRPTPSGKQVHLSLVANPSHLEAVSPVVEGKVRAMQFERGDNKRSILPLLLHGDASFSGQGVVYETLGFASLPCYSTGGTIHIIVNNQIGFTTDPRLARSTPYCSDVAKSIAAPILHVNGDDLEAVVHCCRFASDWRQRFEADIVIDLVCYRRYGHNEVDQPAFTQPRMYAAIAKQPSVLQQYPDKLIREGAMTAEEIEQGRQRVWRLLEQSYANSGDYKPTTREWVTSEWQGFKSPKELSESIVAARSTGIKRAVLESVSQALCTIPEGFNPHKGLLRIIGARQEALQAPDDAASLDMPTAEALAFGSLLLEGSHVRLSGQDVERGTFSQRHAVWHDQEVDNKTYTPLAHLDPTQAPFVVCNSSLSEFGILGFELGYSYVNPNSLVCWEAQFGDFANNAQAIIDQYISSGERKWLQRTGLTLLLPHGYDGAGPEHSNARMERFLSLCDDDPRQLPFHTLDQIRTRQAQDCNMQVVYPSTPANHFHALRRQIQRDFRKPLVLLFSKSLLRHPLARSSKSELLDKTKFVRLYPDCSDAKAADKKQIPETGDFKRLPDDKVERVVFCTGQHYYALLKARNRNNLCHIAIARIEQLSPFPYDLFIAEVDRYRSAKAFVWAQEEPLNLGAWQYIEPRAETALRQCSVHHKHMRLVYAGRAPTAAVATGYKAKHTAEEMSIIAEALLGDPKAKPIKVDTGVPVWSK